MSGKVDHFLAKTKRDFAKLFCHTAYIILQPTSYIPILTDAGLTHGTIRANANVQKRFADDQCYPDNIGV